MSRNRCPICDGKWRTKELFQKKSNEVHNGEYEVLEFKGGNDSYNRILENSTGELIHLREDDIIPYKDGFAKLFNFVTDGIPFKAVAAAGVYFNRHINWQRIVGGFYNKENPKATTDLEKVPTLEPFVIDFTGTGFITFWKEYCPQFRPYIDCIQAHDWAWGLKLKESGEKLWMLPEVVCKHYSTYDEYVEPDMSDVKNVNEMNTFTKITNPIKQEYIEIIKQAFINK